nr:unnamed protein product [Callosobruchus analis]
MAPVDCIICSKAVKTGYSIKHQKCAQWLHRDYANLSIDEIKNLDKELRLGKGKRFYCSICVPQIPKRLRPHKESRTSEHYEDELLQKIKLYFNEKLETQINRIKEENEKLLKVYQQKIAFLEKEVLKISLMQETESQL